MAIPFVKAHACGNDFLIIDATYAPADISDFSRRICDRHYGIGADGVEWLFPDQEADIRARLFNADGSLAEISGNGTRCVAAYIAAEQKKEKILIRTDAGAKTCVLTRRSESRYEFETAMGEPQVNSEFSIKVASGEVRGVPVSMGNPHFVVFVPEFSSCWQTEGAEIGSYQDFKQGMNVEFVVVRDKGNIEVRFFERGVGGNSVVRYGFLRGSSRRYGHKQGGISRASARTRRNAKRALGKRSFSTWSSPTDLSGRMFHLANHVASRQISNQTTGSSARRFGWHHCPGEQLQT
jgi:diaminopimelate epimerase